MNFTDRRVYSEKKTQPNPEIDDCFIIHLKYFRVSTDVVIFKILLKNR